MSLNELSEKENYSQDVSLENPTPEDTNIADSIEGDYEKITFQNIQEKQNIKGTPEINESTRRSDVISKIRLSAALSLFLGAKLLTGCTPIQVQEPNIQNPQVTYPNPMEQNDKEEEYTVIPEATIEVIPTETIILEETTITTPTEIVEEIVEDIPYVSTEKNENFNIEAVNIMEWEDYILEKDIILEESETVITSGGENYLYSLPAAYTSSDSTRIYKFTLLDGYSFNIKEKKVISNSNGETVTLGIVENTFSSGELNTSFALLLDGKDKESEIQGFVEKNEKRYPSVTYINSEPSLVKFMPRIKNELLVLSRISNAQVLNNGFETNTEISLKAFLQPLDSLQYIDNKEHPVASFYLGTDYLASTLKILSIKEPDSLTLYQTAPYYGILLPGIFTVSESNWQAAISKEEGGDFLFQFNGDGEERYMIKIEPIIANGAGLGRIYEADSPKISLGATISLIPYSSDEESEIQLQMSEQAIELQTLYENYLEYLKVNAGKNDFYEDEKLTPMAIPREAKCQDYVFSDFRNLQELIGDDKPILFFGEDLLLWIEGKQELLEN